MYRRAAGTQAQKPASKHPTQILLPAPPVMPERKNHFEKAQN
jgi:hypothetical protein